MNIWYTADLHIGHRLVAGLRRFWQGDMLNTGPTGIPDTDSHNEWLADNWDSVVREDDQVYVLGDISINGKQHALDWIAERPGVKHLIAGNHDPVHPMFRDAPKVMRHWLNYFETIQPFARRRLNGQSFLLSHFPYEAWGDGWEREGTRFVQYRLPDLGLPLLHGHTHGLERAHGNMFHVGVDAWSGQLVPQEFVIDWLDSIKSHNQNQEMEKA